MNKYLVQDENGRFRLKYGEPLKVIDFHIHLSDTLPGNGINSKKGELPRYPTLPPVGETDLSVPYWTRADYLYRKYSGTAAILRFSREGLSIFKDMVRSGTTENCLACQRRNHISRSVILPISTPKADLSMFAIREAGKHPEHLIPFCSVHPGMPDMEARLRAYVDRGAKGMKLKMIDSEIQKHRAKLNRLMAVCAEIGIPVLFHTGSITAAGRIKSRLMKKLLKSTRVEVFESILSDAPASLKFIFGHSGIQEFKKVADLMERYPSSLAELSCQSEGSIRQLIRTTGSERLLFGSDWPALPPAITMAGVLAATEENSRDRDNILHDNACRLLGL